MDNKTKRLPLGVESFEKIREGNFYFVDKTGLIRDLLRNWAEVNLFTRPRRFGKSLNMSMLKEFFDLEGNQSYFEGLKITEDQALCKEYMGKYPVISMSLKSINATSYETARQMAARIVAEEAAKKQFLLNSERLTDYDKKEFLELLDKNMDEAALYSSLRDLSRLLKKHYSSKVILLIDEYDVPLAKAFDHGYYEEMVILIRNMFEQVLKTNENLQFAVLTGCMRIAKESIFTGLNNMRVLSSADVQFDEYFGFTDKEVRQLLAYYDLDSAYDAVKEWYDGYQFGSEEIYCPWDVIHYVSSLCAEPDAQPKNYWANTSGNDAVRKFLREAGAGTAKREIEALVNGEIIEKEIRQELTYKDMYSSVENIWSLLFTTGYLTQRGRQQGNLFRLAIPNMEIRSIFVSQIMEVFQEGIREDGETLKSFCEALKAGDSNQVEKLFGDYLRQTISIRDAFARKEMKENFYHGLLLGLLGFRKTWSVLSNRESGEGYGDILIEVEEEGIGIVVEIKYAEAARLEQSCRAALKQIEEKRYDEVLRRDGMKRILKYGIACHKKDCKVLLSQEG